MSTATADRPSPTPAASGRTTGRTGLVGTRDLVGIALRRDRVRIPVWVLALAGTVAVTIPSLEAAYGDAAARQARVALTSSPAGVLMSGPSFGVTEPTLGAITANEIGLFTYVLVAIMSILLVVRHTRAEEEAGRTEVVRALRVGRSAPGAAAMVAAVVANAAVSLGVALGMQGHGLPQVDVLAFSLSVGAVGVLFAGIAAVTAQLTIFARSASGMAMAALGVAFVLRGAGDALDPVDGSLLTWLSPIGWAQQTRPFVDLRWWPFLLLIGLAIAGIVAAAQLSRRRDVGAGIIATGAARARAPRSLAGPIGLAWRLQRSSAIGWVVALAVFAVLFGLLTETMADSLTDTPELVDWLGLDAEALVTSFTATMLGYLSLGTAVHLIGAVLGLRSEEESGRAQVVIAGGAGRVRYLTSWLAVAAGHAIVVQLLVGLALGVGVAASTGDTGQVATAVTASLAYLPAVLLLGGIAAAVVSLWPRGTALAWAVATYVAFVLLLAPILDLPAWVSAPSPLQATGRVPETAVDAVALLVMGVLAVAMATVAVVGFNRRDLATG